MVLHVLISCPPASAFPLLALSRRERQHACSSGIAGADPWIKSGEALTAVEVDSCEAAYVPDCPNHFTSRLKSV